MLSGSIRWWILLSTVLVCLIGLSSSAPTGSGRYWDFIGILSNEDVWNQVDHNFDIPHIQSWQFTRFREVNECYQQFAIEQNEYYYAEDRTRYRKIRDKPESPSDVHLQDFGLLSWKKLVSAASESAFINSYFYLLFRHYCNSKARFSQPVLQDAGLEPFRTTHIKVLERVIRYIQNIFYYMIYFVPIDTTFNEIDDAVKRYQRTSGAAEVESKLLIAAFLEYCEQVRSDVPLQENNVSAIDEAFSTLLDALDDVRDEKVPVIKGKDLEQRFPKVTKDSTARVDQQIVRNIYKEYSNPEYISDKKYDNMIIFINSFEEAHGMCKSSSSPPLDKLTGQLNSSLKKLFGPNNHGKSLFSQYAKVALCPGMYRQASSTLLRLPEDAKGILSPRDIDDFKTYYMNSLVDCVTMIGKLRPTHWPRCEPRDFKQSLTPIRPLQKTRKQLGQRMTTEDIQTVLQKIMIHDELYFDTWLMLWVMNGWASLHGSAKKNVQTYVQQHINYYTRKKDNFQKLPHIIKAEGQKVTSTTVTTANRSQPNFAETSTARKAKPSRKRRNAGKNSSTEILWASQNQSSDYDSYDGSARTGHGQISSDAAQDQMDATMVQNRNMSLFKSPADIDSIQSIGPGNMNDDQFEHVKKMVANDLISEHSITAVSGRAGDSGLKHFRAEQQGSNRKARPQVYQPMIKNNWLETTGPDPNPTTTAIGIDSGPEDLGPAQQELTRTADVRTNHSELEGNLHCDILYSYST
jgi:hypothetical protein